MDQEQLRLINKENVDKAAQRRNEAKKTYTSTFEKNTTITSPRTEIVQFGDIKPNFKAHSDHEEDAIPTIKE